jgi:hypothetical protein
MYYDPHTHLTIARDRHEDMLREARKAQLARSVERVKHEPAPRPV